MACYDPMQMIVRDFGKCNRNIIERARELNWKINENTYKGYRLVSKTGRGHELEKIKPCPGDEIFEVPCGKCVGCRLDYSKDWANRCDLEARQYTCNYFITLTYDDDHLPIGSEGNGTLFNKEISDFVKRLRQAFKYHYGFDGVRFYGCGEYGDQTFRPHYHIILFNCPIPDLTADFIDENGQITHHKDSLGKYYYFSQFVYNCWKKGNILIADCNWNTSAYVSQYVLKKQKGDGGKVYEALGIIPPYVAMSTKPGIGRVHFDNNLDTLVDFPSLIIPRDRKKPLVSGLPRYYKKLIKANYPEKYDLFIDHSKELIEASRSCLAGKQKINDNRIAKENNIVARNNMIRDID